MKCFVALIFAILQKTAIGTSDVPSAYSNDFDSNVLKLLLEVTSRNYFRYFVVNLEKTCPFWKEFAQCVMEKCAVKECKEDEVPLECQYDESIDEQRIMDPTSSGWVSEEGFDEFARFHGWPEWSHVSTSAFANGISRHDEEEDDEWTDMKENKDAKDKGSIYVDLLKNSESHTGYSGAPARRVWRAILEENCFGSPEDVCVEKRVFQRLMNGLRASISTHIAKDFYFIEENRWGRNYPLFQQAVGSHVDRLNDLRFTYLFVLRALRKAGEYMTGQLALKEDSLGHKNSSHRNTEIDQIPRESESSLSGLLRQLIQSTSVQDFFGAPSGEGPRQCRDGFDESILFQIPVHPNQTESERLVAMTEKAVLQEEFRKRFRNISRLMDCVSCEKCRVWGKLQILGLATAIKILLTSEQKIASALKSASGGAENRQLINRQEAVALVNTLAQLAKSVTFAAEALNEQSAQQNELIFASNTFDCRFGQVFSVAMVVAGFILFVW